MNNSRHVIFDVTIGGIKIDAPNANGRIYSRHLIERAFSKVNWAVPLVFGPDAEASGVNLDCIVGMATDLHISKDLIKCNLSIMNTPNGIIFKEMINENIGYECKPYGIGTCRKTVTGTSVVQNDWTLTGIAIYENTMDIK